MKESLPAHVVREIISDILVEKSCVLLTIAKTFSNNKLGENAINANDESQIELTATKIRNLANNVRRGDFSLAEALELLTIKEQQNAKLRCFEWIEYNKNRESFIR